MLITRQERRESAKRTRRRGLRIENLETRALLTAFFINGDLGSSGADGTAESPFATIQEGVLAAIANPGDDEVIIAPRSNGGVYQGTVHIAGGASDAGKLTLRGATGQASDVVLTTSSGEGIYIGATFEVTIRDLKIEDTAYHGILSRSESVVSVDNVHILSAGFPNGPYYSGIVQQRGDLVVRNSLLQDNWQGLWSAEWRDDASDEIVAQPTNLTIENTIASENLANGFYTRRATGDVSVVDVMASGNRFNGLRAYELESLAVEGSEFSDNRRDGVSIENVLDPTITGASFLRNQSSGGWFNHAPNLTLLDSNAVANGVHGIKVVNADGVLIDEFVADNNGSVSANVTGGGGGIDLLPATAAPIVISNSKISNNETRGYGAGIEIWAMDGSFLANVTVSGTEVRGNTAALDRLLHGGGIGVFGYSNLKLIDSQVVGNTASGTGGVHFGSGGTSDVGEFPTLSIIASTISGNVSVPSNTGIHSGSAGLLQTGGWLEVDSSTISGNKGGVAGGARLRSFGGRITNSTISGNEGLFIGGIDSFVGRNELAIRHTTITGNQGTIVGGLRSQSAQLTLGNSVVAGNTISETSNVPDSTVADLAGFITSVGGNLFGESDSVTISGDSQSTTSDLTGTVAEPLDPELGPLQDNGGPTLTHAPLPGSPLIDGGIDAISGQILLDQRGVPRPQGSAVDIGAVEDIVYAPEVISTEGVVNLNSADKGNKRITIVLYSTADVSPDMIDIDSLVWAGSTAQRSALEDIDGDGDTDLVLEFKLSGLDLVERYRQALAADDSNHQQRVEVPLTGSMVDGKRILSSATVDLVMTGKSLRELLETV